NPLLPPALKGNEPALEFDDQDPVHRVSEDEIRLAVAQRPVAVAVEPADVVEDMPPLRHLPGERVEEFNLSTVLRVLSAREVNPCRAERSCGTHGGLRW